VGLRARAADALGYVLIADEFARHERGMAGFDPGAELDGLAFALRHPGHARAEYVWNMLLAPHAELVAGVVEKSVHDGFRDASRETVRSVFGALAAGEDVPAARVEALRGYGEFIGLAFQIADDVLDATATSDQLGKTAGKDEAQDKTTFVTLLGVGASRAEAERLSAAAVARLLSAGLVSPTLVELAHYIVTRPN